jgi:hypothetical protein
MLKSIGGPRVELSLRISTLESQLSKSDKKISDMSKIVQKLHSFKQQVYESFVEDDSLMSDLMNKTDNLSMVCEFKRLLTCHSRYWSLRHCDTEF